MRKPYIDFMGKRNVFFIVSALILAVAVGALIFKPLNLGIEFKGGTIITLNNTKGATIAQVRVDAAAAGVPDAEVQATDRGFRVRSTEVKSVTAEQQASVLAASLKVASTDLQVSTIGPEWGTDITNKAMLALVVSLIAILVYISIRFEYKMAVTGVIALVHDALITLGIYALLGRPVTPNTVAALLTILGYSLYDTIVVLHRIRENTQSLSKTTFMQMANDSLNQVLARWVNTGL